MLGINSPPTTMQGRRHKRPARIDVRIVHVQLLMHHRVVQADHLVVHFHGVRHQNGILIDAQHSFRQAGFAVAGGPVDEDGVLRDQRRAELIEQLIGDHQVRKRRAQDFAVDADLRRLRFGGAVVILQGNRGGARRIG